MSSRFRIRSGSDLLKGRSRHSVTMRGYAKLNLALAVVGRRPDGYHELDTVMRTVSLWDDVRVTRTREPGIVLSCSDPRVPCDGRNTAYRAAERFWERARPEGGVGIHIWKRIPMEAGMGGSSADAAAVLNALCLLFGRLPADEWNALAASLGADVPFQLEGGLARCRGIGERLVPLDGLRGDWYVVCKPPFGVRTPEAFAAYDHMERPYNPDAEALCEAAGQSDLPRVAALLGNALEQAVGRAELGALRRALLGAGALGACMTGSGSAVFGLFDCSEKAERAAGRLRGELPGTDIFCVSGVPGTCLRRDEAIFH